MWSHWTDTDETLQNRELGGSASKATRRRKQGVFMPLQLCQGTRALPTSWRPLKVIWERRQRESRHPRAARRLSLLWSHIGAPWGWLLAAVCIGVALCYGRTCPHTGGSPAPSCRVLCDNAAVSSFSKYLLSNCTCSALG